MNTSRRIDLNCDIGERDDAQALCEEVALLGVVSSINVACGGHAGDRESMERLVRAAVRLGVRIGAHPSYPDRSNFGRSSVPMSPEELERSVHDQVAALASVCRGFHTTISHVKPHGALYHDSADRVVALSVARGAARAAGDVSLVAQAGAASHTHWLGAGFRAIGEGFADRRYASATTLRARSLNGAILSDPAAAARQALALANRGEVETDSGPARVESVRTLCVHSDTPGAVVLATHVRAALEADGWTIA
jgi:UPF0271 protein